MIADKSSHKEGGGWKLELIVEWREISGKFFGFASSVVSLVQNGGCNV